MQLENRVALITGGGRGIGRAIARTFAREGARLALAARTVSELEETAQQVESLGAVPWIVRADVADESQVEEMVRKTVDHFSTIDILINNAGVGGPVGPLQDNDVSYWIRTIQVNLIGLFLCCGAVLPVMLSHNRGKIVNMSGVGGRNSSAYGASKTALVYVSEVLSKELEGTNIQVNAMSPGSIHTRMWEETRDAAMAVGDAEIFELGQRVTSGRGASVERAADLALFLATDASDGLTGRLIEAVNDDFYSLSPRIPEIMASEAYTMRRVELPARRVVPH